MTPRIEQLCSIGDARYLVSLETVGVFPGSWSSKKLSFPVPITLIRVDGLELITSTWLQESIDEMLASDDVLCEKFSSFVIVQHSSHSKTPSFEADFWPGVKANIASSTGDLPSGPYVLGSSGIHKVYKLFPDPCGAFIYGVRESSESPGSYQRVFGDHIPIPSRHYYPQPSSSLPLSGKRIAVKDIYDVRGLKTSICSKAYEAIHGEATTTAASIQRITDLGGLIIGKTKTVQFASGMAPRDWIDYQCPFNPRGDGYLDPDCSSSGSAVGIAAYDWLDFSVGSDSLGSMVGPAAACGIFGLRPTHGVLSNEGALAVSSYFDTPGLFSRNVSEFRDFAKAWLKTGDSDAPFKFPTRVLFPSSRFAMYAEPIWRVMESFIQEVEKSTPITLTEFDINKLWKVTAAPSDAASKNLDEYLYTTVAHIQLHDSYHNNLKFRSEYKTKFGREAYVDPLIQYKWDLGATLMDDDYKQALEEKAVFKKFLEEHVLTEGTVMLLPGGNTDVSYRDEYSGTVEESGRKWQGFSFKNTAFSVLGGGCSISFPVGQRLYDSRVSGSAEYQPVSLMLLGAAGTDVYLINLIKRLLESTGRPVTMKTGKTAC